MKPGKCGCSRDEDGQCVDCRSRISEAMKTLAAALRTFVESMERLKGDLDGSIEGLRQGTENLCRDCARRYGDLAMSKMLGFLDGSRQSVAEAVYSSIIDNMRRRVRKRPLTERAWADLCRRNGWSRRR